MKGEHATGPSPPPGGERLVIGWNEYVDLPDWGVRRLHAKVDTGARTSALHVEEVEELPRDRLRFRVVLETGHRRVPVVARVVRTARVRSSNGGYEVRRFVRTVLRLGPVEREIEISLVDRQEMVFRMLLGRSALDGAFLVDPAHRVLVSRRRRS